MLGIGLAAIAFPACDRQQELDAGLVGMSVGESKDVHATFPADYGADNLAGKPATFDVKVTLVHEAKDAAMDDTFAQKVYFLVQQLNL